MEQARPRPVSVIRDRPFSGSRFLRESPIHLEGLDDRQNTDGYSSQVHFVQKRIVARIGLEVL